MNDVKAGVYKACRGVLGSQQYATNPENGNDQIAIDVYVPELDRSFTTFLYFTDKAAPYAIERLRALGWKGDDLTDLSGIDANDVDVLIKYEKFDGKDRIKVDIVTGGSGRVKLDKGLMDEKQKRAFAARIKLFLKGTSPKPAAAPANATKREGAFDPGPDAADDIPF